MKWKHIMDIQPENGREIIQCDRPYDGHYTIGMRKYIQNTPFDEVIQWSKKYDWPIPDFWWVYLEEFPFPEESFEKERRYQC